METHHLRKKKEKKGKLKGGRGTKLRREGGPSMTVTRGVTKQSATGEKGRIRLIDGRGHTGKLADGDTGGRGTPCL